MNPQREFSVKTQCAESAEVFTSLTQLFVLPAFKFSADKFNEL